ncbi:MAG TPA: hypothetical protein VGJ31_04220 [Dongiaceae bacterium]|jgi:hypothetical protein
MTATKKQSAPRKQGDSGWSKAEDELKKTPRGQNEGEGSRSAAAAYDHSQTDFARSGDVTGQANAAKKAMEGTEREELQDAERTGKSHSHGEDPSLYRKGPGSKESGKDKNKARD